MATSQGSNATGDWFVEFKSTPVLAGGSSAQIQAEKEAFDSAVSDLDVEVTESHDQLWAGVVVTADQAEVARIQERVEVASIFPVLRVDAPEKLDFQPETSGTSSPEMTYARGITGADVAYDELGVDGTGITVGIIDSGIDIDHPAFGGSGVSGTTPWSTVNGNGGKIVGGYDLVGDDFNIDPASPTYNPVRTPDENPDDCGGHGTHVAGITAGNDAASGFLGVAPGADLRAYRVFGCDGSTSSDIMLEAMEMAAADGVDVVNMSIGASFMTWPNYPTAVAADHLVDAGVVVTVSQGNSGEYGVFSGGAPAVAEKVIAVASVDNVASEATGFAVDGVDDLIPYSPSTGSPAAPTEGSLDLVAYPEGSETGAVPIEGAEGKAVLVKRGSSSFYEKALAAQESGAAAVIIDNNEPGIINATVEGEQKITIPVVTIQADDGASIRAALTEGTQLTWTDEGVESPIPTGGLISDFSSYGLSADLSLKPQLSAPGGLINSSYPLDAADGDGTGWATLSGTSMAAPHVAGAAALVLQANPSLNPDQVKVTLQNASSPTLLSILPETGFPELVHRDGAGLINIPAAVQARTFGTVVTPSEINLYDGSDGATETHTLSIHNSSNSDEEYTVTHVPGLTTWGLNTAPSLYADSADATLSAETLTIPAGGDATVDVTITEPANAAGATYGGYIFIDSESGSQVTVPYAGLAGDYESDLAFIYPWTYADYGYTADELPAGISPDDLTDLPPTLGVLASCGKIVEETCVSEASFNIADDLQSYDLTEANDPYVLIHAENPLSSLTIEAFHVNNDGSKGAPLSPDYNYVYESDGEGAIPGFVDYPWDGTYQKSATATESLDAPDGKYLLEVTAVKGMGDPSNPDDVETWTSPVFVIDRGSDAPAPPAGNDFAYMLFNSYGTPAYAKFNFGRSTDEVFVGDWDGDGIDTLAVRRGKTFFVQNKLTGGNAETSFIYGRVGDEVLVGDWDGDGKDTFAVRRGNEYHVQNALVGGNAATKFYYGRAKDEVLVGDWNASGQDTFGVRRGNTFYLRNSLSGGNADISFGYGRATDEVLVGDWDGDGQDTITVRRGNSFYVANDLRTNAPVRQINFGRASDQVLVGDWNGDGIDWIGIRR